MKLTRVTLTGADDSVKPLDLLRLSLQYPFVEWGILFSASAGAAGAPRFPSTPWVKTFLTEVSDTPVSCAAHLCGRYVRDIMIGHATWFRDYPTGTVFQRIQLNGRIVPLVPVQDSLPPESKIIVQADGINDDWARQASEDGEAVPLFDRSGGAGISPLIWPVAWPGIECGYAGGLGPDNVVAQVAGPIAEAAGDATIWIDMETHVRSANDLKFDLEKCRRVLDQIAPLVAA